MANDELEIHREGNVISAFLKRKGSTIIDVDGHKVDTKNIPDGVYRDALEVGLKALSMVGDINLDHYKP